MKRARGFILLLVAALAPGSASHGATAPMWMTRALSTPFPIATPSGTRVTRIAAYVHPLEIQRRIEFPGIRPGVLEDGTVVLGTEDGKVLWLKNGVKTAEFATGNRIAGSPAILSDGTVVIGSWDHSVYWLRDGAKLHEFTTGSSVRSSPALLSDGTVVVGSDDGNLYWLRDGVERYRLKRWQGERHWVSSPTVLADDTVVVLPPQALAGEVVWAKNGIQTAKLAVPGTFDGGSAVAIGDRTVVFPTGGGRAGKLIWADPGSFLGDFHLDYFYYGVSPVKLPDATVVMYAHDRLWWIKEGKLDIESVLESSMGNPPPGFLADGTVITSHYASDTLFWIRNGHTLFRHQLGTPEHSHWGKIMSTPVVLADGVVVVVSGDNVQWLKVE